MKCPKCDTDMTSMAHQGVMVDRCNQCHGIWLDKKELEVVLEKKLARSFDVGRYSQLPPEADEASARCRRCQADMVALDGAADVRFDWCPECEGMFFDRGELTVIDEFRPDD